MDDGNDENNNHIVGVSFARTLENLLVLVVWKTNLEVHTVL